MYICKFVYAYIYKYKYTCEAGEGDRQVGGSSRESIRWHRQRRWPSPAYTTAHTHTISIISFMCVVRFTQSH